MQTPPPAAKHQSALSTCQPVIFRPRLRAASAVAQVELPKGKRKNSRGAPAAVRTSDVLSIWRATSALLCSAMFTWDHVWFASLKFASETMSARMAFSVSPFTRDPLMKNVAGTWWRRSVATISGVVAGLGPSSKVRATRLAKGPRSGTRTPEQPVLSALASSFSRKDCSNAAETSDSVMSPWSSPSSGGVAQPAVETDRAKAKRAGREKRRRMADSGARAIRCGIP